MNTSHRLFRDQRGAVMIFGVVMGMLLVGALWHVASVGNAILWRERAQDAADAGAFENAVWHARGMNLLVSLNLIMQVVLAVLVFWRMLFILVGLAIVLAGLLCVVTIIVGGEGCGALDATVQLADKMRKLDKPISQTIMKILGGMRVAEYAVSEVTPALALRFGASHTRDAYPALTDATTWSASLLPSFSIAGLKDIKTCFTKAKDPTADDGEGDGTGDPAGGTDEGGDPAGGGTADGAPAEGGDPSEQDPSKWSKVLDGYKAGLGLYNGWVGTPRLSMPLSLPVSAGSYSLLCGKAGELVVDGVGKVIELIHVHIPQAALNRASSIVSNIVKSTPNVFCMPFSDTGPLKDAMGDLEGDAEKKCADEMTKDTSIVVEGSDPKDPKYHEYGKKKGKAVSRDDWLKGCKKGKLKEAKDKLDGVVKGTQQAAEACGKPADVWGYAANGNVFMRSFSSVTQRETMSASDARGIDMADESRTGNVDPVTTGNVGAHAEMYYDCAGAWSGCKGEAMWNLKWEARLRRVQPLPTLASTPVEQIASTALSKIAGKPFTSLLDEILHDHVRIPYTILPTVGNIPLFALVKGKAIGFGYGHSVSGQVDGVRETILRHGGSNSVVH